MYRTVTQAGVEPLAIMAPMVQRVIPLPGLKHARESALVTQTELAERAGVSRFTIQRLEARGGTARLVTIRKLAAALKVKPAALTGPAA